jgi:hypothetical protein
VIATVHLRLFLLELAVSVLELLAITGGQNSGEELGSKKCRTSLNPLPNRGAAHPRIGCVFRSSSFLLPSGRSRSIAYL